MLFPLVPLALAGLGAPACADPHGDLDDYVARSGVAPPTSGGTGGMGGTGGLGDVSGTFLFACTNQLYSAVSSAIRFRATNVMTLQGPAGAPTGAELQITLQPLLAVATNASEVLGAAISLGEAAAVGADGRFFLTLPEVAVDGTANPTGTSVLLTNMKHSAVVASADLFCSRFRTTVAEPPLGDFDYAKTENACFGVRLAADGALPDKFDAAPLNTCTALLADTPAPP